MPKDRAYDLGVEIDPHRLDDEWVGQPDKMYRAGDILADAKDRADRAKARRHLVKAEVELRVRKNPAAFGLDRATEASIAAVIITVDEYKDALDKVHRTKLKVGRAAALEKATEQRKSALENLVKLHLANYYGDPQAPAGATRANAARIMAGRVSTPLTTKKEKR